MKVLRADRCQCCNTSLDHGAHNVFDEDGRTQNIAALLHDYIGKQLNESDGIDYAICDPCWHQLLQCHAFKQKCIRANALAGDDNPQAGHRCLAPTKSTSPLADPYGRRRQQSQLGAIFDRTNDNVQLTIDRQLLEYTADGMVIEYLDDDDLYDDDNADRTFDDMDEDEMCASDFTSILVKPSSCDRFDECLSDLARVKRKTKLDIPHHVVGGRNEPNGQAVDDLVHILQDNYHSDQMRTGASGIAEAEFVNMDQYVKSIATIVYEEYYEPCIRCVLCAEELQDQHHLVRHTSDCHMSDGGFSCVMDENCCIFNDLVAVQRHIFEAHIDSIPTRLHLTCTTCDNTFRSSVQFGKHMCLSLDDENDGFQCVTCEKKLNSRNRYLFHTQFHLDNARPKVCIICELRFHTEEAFYNHVMFVHEPQLEHFCQFCDATFRTNGNLEEHMRAHHPRRTPGHALSADKSGTTTAADRSTAGGTVGDKLTERSLACPTCKKVYNRMSRLRKHMTSHESFQKSSVLVCDSCSMAFASLEEVDEHCVQQHDDDIANIIEKEILFVVCCEFCEHAFTDRVKLLKHKTCHSTDDKPFKCEFCMATYETFSKLKTHKNTHVHQQTKFPVERQYMCDIENCWKRYRHWGDLSIHRKNAHLINPTVYKCPECEQTFYQSWKFSYHKKTVHAHAAVHCDACGEQCANTYSLKHHRKKCHTPDERAAKVARPRQCNKPKFDMKQHIDQFGTTLICRLCGKHLATRTGARTHVEMTHMKLRHHRCDTCGKEFYLRKDYADHMRLHTSEMPYQCEVCLRKFRTASAVNDHRRNHSDDRPHSCPYCTAAFKRAYVLKNHIKQHIGVKGFPCLVGDCKKEYRTQWELNSHRRTKHANEQINQIDDRGLVNELPRQLLNDGSECGKSSPPKARNKQKIIYVLPGPQSNYSPSENTPIDRNVCFDSQTIVKTSEVDHNYLRTTDQCAMPTSEYTKVSTSKGQSLLKIDASLSTPLIL